MPVSQRLRFEVIKRDNQTCRYCGAKAPDVALTVDHVVPKALGGSDDPSNLVAACQPCNSGKSSVAPDADLVGQVADDALRFAAALQRVTEERRQKIRDMAANVEWFNEAWLNWTRTDRHGVKLSLDRDGDWGASVERFFAAGLDRNDLNHAITKAMTNRQARDQWRLFCRYAWDEINLRQETARTAITSVVAVEAAGDKESPEYLSAYDDGFNDGIIYERWDSNRKINNAYELGKLEGLGLRDASGFDPSDDDTSDLEP